MVKKKLEKVFYSLDTTFGNGMVCVNPDGYIDNKNTCPLYIKVFKRNKFWKTIDYLKRTKKMIGLIEIKIEDKI